MSIAGTASPNEIYRQALATLGTPKSAEYLGPIEGLLRSIPGEHRLWYIHGMILRQLDRRGEALPSLHKAVELQPDQPLLWHGLGRTKVEAGLPGTEEYGQALRLSPGDPEIIEGMTAALIAEGNVTAALAGLEQIMARSPQWIEGQKLLGQLRWMSGERIGFDRGFSTALQSFPTNYGLRYEQILALTHAEQWEELLQAVAAGRKAMGDLPLFAVNEAVALSEMGDTDAAELMFQQLGNTDDVSVDVRHIRNHLRAGRPAEAAALIEPWLTRDAAQSFWPYAATAWRMLGDERWKWLEGDDRFVGVYDIADLLPPLDELADALRARHTAHGQLIDQSVRGGTQTDGHLFHLIDPTIVKLREALREVVAKHVAQLPAHDERHPLLGPARQPIAFSGAWSVRLLDGGHHSNHVHPMGWMSSALYIVLPPKSGDDPQAGWLKLGEPHAQLGLDLPPFRTVEPKPGRLVLFPSTMWHGTRPFESGERLTVAFDVALNR